VLHVVPGSAIVHLDAAKLSRHHSAHGEEDVMERRHFLKLALGFAAGAATLAASAQAAPLMPHPLEEDGRLPPSNEDPHPAVTTGNEVEHLKPEEVRGDTDMGGARGAGGIAAGDAVTGAGAAVIGAGVVAIGAGVVGTGAAAIGAAVTGEVSCFRSC
jgi:hypothetical protein